MFADRLRELRTEHGYTQAELGKLLKLEGPAISKYELGLREPSLSMLDELSKIFDVSVDYLLGKTDQRNIPKQDKDFMALYKGYSELKIEDRKRLDDYYQLLLEKNKKKGE